MTAKKTKRKTQKTSSTKSNSTKHSQPIKQGKPDLTRYVKVDRVGKVPHSSAKSRMAVNKATLNAPEQLQPLPDRISVKMETSKGIPFRSKN